MDLQRFAGSLTLTVTNDGHFSATSASPASSLAEGDKSTLTITPSSGYELDEIVVLSGGATVAYDNEASAWKVTMGSENASVFVRGKKNNLYKVVENTHIWINGTKTELTRNMTLVRGVNGAIVDVTGDPAEISLSADMIDALVKQGAIVKA